jgi:uncharacterized protein (TIGR03435 family)
MTLPTFLSLAANHLWQSTLFAFAVGLLALVLRKNHARTRYWIWWIASVKFLVPFSLLVNAGSYFSLRTTPALVTEGSVSALVIGQVTQPFTSDSVWTIVPGAVQTSPGAVFALLPTVLIGAWFCGCGLVFLRWWGKWRRARAFVWNANRQRVALLTKGRELETLRRLERTAGTRSPLAIAASAAAIEPSVLGLIRPVLVWPVGLSERLRNEELEAILLHELAHVRRRDNLTAALHMVVEAIFWFHPLVWWIGVRLIDEREKACDEAVLRWGGASTMYAEGILKVCEFCLESPLVCAAGVTGSDLKKRIEDIMRNGVARRLSFGATLLLVAAAIMAVAGPLMIGAVKVEPGRVEPEAAVGAEPAIPPAAVPIAIAQEPAATAPTAQPQATPQGPQVSTQNPGQRNPDLVAEIRAILFPVETRETFEVASIRLNTGAPVGGTRGGGPGGARGGGPAGPTPCGGLVQVTPGRFVATNVSLYRLITLAYGKNCRLAMEQDLLTAGPDWRQSVAYDIQATMPSGFPAYTQQQLAIGEAPRLQILIQNLLADRFNLVLHRDTKEIPIYNLVLVKMARIKLSEDQTPPPPPTPPTGPPQPRDPSAAPPRGSYGLRVDPPAGKVTILASAIPISNLIDRIQGGVYRMVVDKTELKGLYDIPEVTLDVGPFDIAPGATTVWPEIMQQLGLKMDPTRGPVEFLVIDRAEKPSEN